MHLEKNSQKYSTASFVLDVNRFHPLSSNPQFLFRFGLLLSYGYFSALSSAFLRVP